MRFCGIMKMELKDVEVHDLWLAASFLYPYLRDIEFWKNPIKREQFRTRAESLTRVIAGVNQSTPVDNNTSASYEVESDPIHADNPTLQLRLPASRLPPSKRRKFSLKDQINQSTPLSYESDEVTRYKSTRFPIWVEPRWFPIITLRCALFLFFPSKLISEVV